jgi:hypothetical protein
VNEHREPSWFKDRRVIVLGVGCVMAGFLVALLIFGEPWHLPPDWGDIPTWLAVIVATIGGWTALAQLRQQQAVIQADFERQAKRDQLLDAQIQEAAAWAQARVRVQAEAIEFSGDAKLRKGSKPDASGVTHWFGWCRVDNDSPRPIWGVAPRLLVNGQRLPPASFREHHERGGAFGGGWVVAADESVDDAPGGSSSCDRARSSRPASRYPAMVATLHRPSTWSGSLMTPKTAGNLAMTCTCAVLRTTTGSESSHDLGGARIQGPLHPDTVVGCDPRHAEGGR